MCFVPRYEQRLMVNQRFFFPFLEVSGSQVIWLQVREVTSKSTHQCILHGAPVGAGSLRSMEVMSPIKTEVPYLLAWRMDTISAVESSFQNYWPAQGSWQSYHE